MNFGHGELGFGACPSAKSKPVAENCTLFSVSTPIAFDAFAMTVRASCAEAVQMKTMASASVARDFFTIEPPRRLRVRAIVALLGLRLELQCDAVHAISLARRLRAIRKHVTEMSAALRAVDLDPRHAVAAVDGRRDG